MRVLVIGSGAREHALSWRLSECASVDTVWCAPGNPGIAEVAKVVAIEVDQLVALKEFALRNKIDLTVVGPELPLSLGIVDIFRAAGLAIFGASKDAALLEGSKGFAKSIMSAAGVPTAAYSEARSRNEADRYCELARYPLVLKADGLAAGKGVVICPTPEDAIRGLDFLFNEIKAESLVIEEFVEGVEVSYIVATDGERIVPLATSHDYKRIFDGNQGANTGGMGAVSPTPYISPEKENELLTTVIEPIIRTMKERGTPFSGFLYAGLILRNNGTPSVLEFNTRLGDPECQVIMRRVDFDLAKVLLALAAKSELPAIAWKKETAVCVVMASAGYPNKNRVGDIIHGIKEAENIPSVKVFQAGTKMNNNSIVTAGGRVLSVTAVGEDFNAARTDAYSGVQQISFEGSHIRLDIGESNECKLQS